MLKVLTNSNKYSYLLSNLVDRKVVEFAAVGHDLIEDARMTYNDVKDELIKILMEYDTIFDSKRDATFLATKIADIIYCVTDEKGKTRGDRKNHKYYKELTKNSLAVYVKLCDILANTEHSRDTKSNMYKKYREEFTRVEKKFSDYEIKFKSLIMDIKNILL